MKRSLLLAIAACAALSSLSVYAETQTQWMKILLDGRKVGQMESTREVTPDRVLSTERMSLVLDRAGVSLPVTTEEQSIETRDGRPLGFVSRSSMSGLDSTVEGTLGEDGTLTVRMRAGSSEQQRVLPWPKGALLSEGARRAEIDHGRQPGTRFTLLSFQPSTLSALPVVVEVIGKEVIEVAGKRRRLLRLDQIAALEGAPLRMSAWVDDAHEVQRATLPLLGMRFEMLACDQACATAPNQPTDILDRVVVAAPRTLTDAERAAGLAYRIRLRDAASASLPSLAEQQAERQGKQWRVVVHPGRSASNRADPPTAADTAATRWLDHDAPALQAMARSAVGAEPHTDSAATMRRLEEFVREHIENKSMRVGYASASQTATSREGDCTEHAVLLAALGRGLGIPTRVVNGLVYAPEFAGRGDVFVPHAWVMAWDGKAWRGYDAALAGFDAGHIALSVGDGDAAGFYAGVALLGNLDVVAADPLPGPQP